MTISKELGAIIKKIKEQSREIDEITNRKYSENLLQIETLINEINSEFLPNKILFFAIIIDTILFYFKNKADKENESLIDNCLGTLINKLNDLPNDEIKTVVSNLKKYIKTNDAVAKSALEKFVGKSVSSTSRFELIKDISKSIVLSCEKYKLGVNNPFKTQVNTIAIAEIVTEADSGRHFSFFEGVSYAEKFTNYSKSKEKIRRKKIKPRTIIFDDDSGIGYDQYSSHWYFKEANRLSDINFEVEPSSRIKKKILHEELLREELDRLGKIEVNLELYSNRLEKEIKIKEFELFASPEEKEARKRNINESVKNTKKIRESCKNDQKRQARAKKISGLLDPIVFLIQERINQCKEKSSNNNKHVLGLKLPFFEATRNDFVNGFLTTINYDQLRELINYAENVSISIDQIKKSISKIDNFFKSFGLSSNYMAILDESQKKLKEVFNKDQMFNYLDLSLNLYRQRTLNFDNNYCLLSIKEQKEEIKFSEPVFLDKFISKNTPEVIFKSLLENTRQLLDTDKKSQTLIRNTNFGKKDNIFKKWFYYFSGKYYFLNLNHKHKFVKKFFLNSLEHPNFESIKIETLKLKWWHFILMGLSPFIILKKDFKKLLAKKLFLNLIEEEFNKIDKEPNIKNIDAMYSIQQRLNSSNISDKNQSISLPLMNVFLSPKEIIDHFNQHEEIKELLEKVSNLTSQSIWCVNEFSKILNACERESEKISPSADLSKKIFLKIL